MLRKALLVFFAVAGASLASAATTNFGPFSVDARSNIFAAGGNINLQPGYGVHDGINPYELNFGSVAGGSSFSFGPVTGSVGCLIFPANGADGSCSGGLDTRIQSADSISGINTTGRNMFLTGVFLGAGVPSGAPPASLSYPNSAAYSQSSYAPLLEQVFFIGDGLTGTNSGAQQTFFVPTGATRLFLGFADALVFGADRTNGRQNGFYADNVGSLRVSASLNAVPEPGTFAIAVLGLAGAVLVRLRRRY